MTRSREHQKLVDEAEKSRESNMKVDIICDSINEQGNRLTTFKLRYPRFIHAEFMTHRMISRNASGSRAVPTKKLIEEVRSDAMRAAPIFWGRNQKGMQAVEELSDAETLGSLTGGKYSPKWAAQLAWSTAAYYAVEQAEKMVKLEVHKQIVNRILEPFVHINVIATATEWDNFFGLRLHKDAQPEIKALAIAMWFAREASTPGVLVEGCWHLPFVETEDYRTLGEEDGIVCTRNDPLNWNPVKVSVARCARVSYESHETGKRSTVEEDLKLYERLVGAQPMHASPAEHQATPDQYTNDERGGGSSEHAVSDWPGGWLHQRDWGNFVGWRQYRKMLPGEACAPLPEGY